MKTFNSSDLGFSISYPDAWQVIPAPWAKQFLSRAKTSSEKMNEYFKNGSPPFLLAHDPLVPQGIAIPALKCRAYSLPTIAALGGINGLMQGMNKVLHEAYPDFEMREYVAECVVAGVVGATLLAAMTVQNQEGASFHGLTELLFLPTNRYVFTVGLTATSDLKFRPENELSAIKRSIRLH